MTNTTEQLQAATVRDLLEHAGTDPNAAREVLAAEAQGKRRVSVARNLAPVAGSDDRTLPKWCRDGALVDGGEAGVAARFQLSTFTQGVFRKALSGTEHGEHVATMLRNGRSGGRNTVRVDATDPDTLNKLADAAVYAALVPSLTARERQRMAKVAYMALRQAGNLTTYLEQAAEAAEAAEAADADGEAAEQTA